jgi:hypothetical protein
VGRCGEFGAERKGKLEVPFPEVDPNEGLLMGARTPFPANGGGDWIVTKPEHWIFEGTGMKKGDFIRGLVGWEFHGEPADLPGLEILAKGIALSGGTRPVRGVGHHAPRAEGQLRFQCRHYLVVAWLIESAGPRPALESFSPFPIDRMHGFRGLPRTSCGGL